MGRGPSSCCRKVTCLAKSEVGLVPCCFRQGVRKVTPMQDLLREVISLQKPSRAGDAAFVVRFYWRARIPQISYS